MTDNISTIIGFSLFVISEILPFINVPTNGFLHTLILGLSNAFKNKEKDIEMAQVLVEKQSFADIINTVSTNPQIKTVIESLINNPQFSNTLHSLLNNNSLYIQLQKLTNNTQLQSILNIFIDEPHLISHESAITLKLLNPQNTILLNKLSKDVQMSTIIDNILSIDPIQKEAVLNIVGILKSHPDMIPNINSLVNQSIM